MVQANRPQRWRLDIVWSCSLKRSGTRLLLHWRFSGRPKAWELFAPPGGWKDRQKSCNWIDLAYLSTFENCQQIANCVLLVKKPTSSSSPVFYINCHEYFKNAYSSSPLFYINCHEYEISQTIMRSGAFLVQREEVKSWLVLLAGQYVSARSSTRPRILMCHRMQAMGQRWYISNTGRTFRLRWVGTLEGRAYMKVSLFCPRDGLPG